jgi:hypothetical protein
MGIQVVKNTYQHTEEQPSRIRRELEGGLAHFQLTGVSDANRAYGASRDFPVTEQLVAFLQGLASEGLGRTVPSLADTGRAYMAFRYYFMTDDLDLVAEVEVRSVKVEVDLPADGATIPVWATPYVNGNTIAAVFTEVPLGLIQAIA